MMVSEKYLFATFVSEKKHIIGSKHTRRRQWRIYA